MQYQYTPFTFFLLISFTISFFIFIYIARKASTTGRIPFSIFMFSSALWSLAYAGELSSANIEAKWAWFMLQAVGFLTLPVAYLYFAKIFIDKKSFNKYLNIIFISIPVIVFIFVITNSFHHFYITRLELFQNRSYIDMHIFYGPVFWFQIVFSYSTALYVFFKFIRAYYTSMHLYKKQAIALLLAGTIPVVSSSFSIIGFNPYNVEYATFIFSITGIIIIFGLYQYRLLDIIPVARNQIVEIMEEAVLVFDSEKRLIDFNTRASEIFNLTKIKSIGVHFETEFANWPPFVNCLKKNNFTSGIVECNRHDKGSGKAKYYDIKISKIRTQSDKINAYILVMHDITERKQESQLLKISQQELKKIVKTRTNALQEANKALIESEEKMFQFIDSATEVFMVWNQNFELLLINRLGIQIFAPGAKRMDLYKKPIQEIFVNKIDEKLLNKYKNVLETGIPFSYDETINVLNNKEYNVQLRVFKTGSELGMILIDMTEHIKSAQELNNALHEKEVLLKEIHHRVKNNMQVISSLLSIQAANITEPHALEAFEESRNRIRSMALIHESLYRSDNLAQIHFGYYVDNLAKSLYRSMQTDMSKINLKVNISDVFIDIASAIPCGLLLNELITNSLKHAFTNLNSGVIAIHFEKLDHSFKLVYQDNGRGLPENLDIAHSNTLGLELVQSLTKQLKGTLDVRSDNGTIYELTFPS